MTGGPLDHRDINGGYDPRIKGGVTGETPNPLDLLREFMDDMADALGDNHEDVCAFRAALAQVEALAEAARWIEAGGHYSDCDGPAPHRACTCAKRRAHAALVPFAARENTNAD